jgi:hypothetical protein
MNLRFVNSPADRSVSAAHLGTLARLAQADHTIDFA